jgi:hypothetical protein
VDLAPDDAVFATASMFVSIIPSRFTISSS